MARGPATAMRSCATSRTGARRHQGTQRAPGGDRPEVNRAAASTFYRLQVRFAGGAAVVTTAMPVAPRSGMGQEGGAPTPSGLARIRDSALYRVVGTGF